MMKFNLYYADSVGQLPPPIFYPHSKTVQTVNDLVSICKKDHNPIHFKNDKRRKNENFFETDCVTIDIDNDKCTSVDDCMIPETISELLQGVEFYAVTSSHHMKEKHKGKNDAFPRWHCYFPLTSAIRNPEKLQEIRLKLATVISVGIDLQMEVSKGYFGHNKPEAKYFPGDIDIRQYFTNHPEITPLETKKADPVEQRNILASQAKEAFDAEFQTQNINTLLDCIPANCSEIDWTNVCCALINAGFSYDIFLDWSRTGGSSFTGESDCLKKWNAKRRNTVKGLNFAWIYSEAVRLDPSVKDRLVLTGEAKENHERKLARLRSASDGENQMKQKSQDKKPDSAATVTIETGSGTLTVNQASEMKPAENESTESIAKRLLKTLSDVQDTEKRYIFRPYLPVGKFSILSADPGVGKTKAVCAISALITTGSQLLGIPCEKPGNVLLFSREDDGIDFKQTVKACGGDIKKVHIVDESDEALDLLSKHKLTYDSPVVEEMIKLCNPSLIIFDPYQKYLSGRVDMNRANQLSDALAPVIRLAKKYDCHIMIIAHNSKAQTGLQYKFMGSADFLGEARSGFSVVRDPDRIEEQENIIIPVKTNNRRGKAIRYKIESIPGHEDFATVKWLALENYTEQDYAKSQRKLLSDIQKKDTTCTPENPIIQTALILLKDNPDGVALSYQDFSTAIEKCTGKLVDLPYEREIRKLSAWMDANYGIGIACKSSQKLRPYYLKGEQVIPSTNYARRIVIKRNRMPDQQQLKIDLDTED